ncbi:MAG: exopolysaccharide biosynthesis polyprenyl glycosylphosphotransferase [Asticcacaulis sp.]|uniref:exopolysaccharide biosynthesis polyprenyl glycosylphosphotransferase n=1 Tax=Asticcacaulis sp. TaxID=1872648 RepID=UPI003F7C6E62
MNAAFKLSDSAPPPLNLDPSDRRGPFRPEKLISPRLRRSGAMSVRIFRGVDLAALLLTGVLNLVPVLRPDWRQASLGDILPFLAPALLIPFCSGAFDLYSFMRRENLLVHLARLAFVIAPGFALALLVAGVSPDRPYVFETLTQWGVNAASVLAALHGLWWLLIWRWRRQGRLTPNVVVVGATRHAQKLIETAMQRRDVNILGVFDDRLSRNPDALVGVPVLGDVQSLLGHKITPFVDQIVVAIDTSAKARVKTIVEKLRSLPNQVSLLVDVDTDDERRAALSRLSNLPLARVSGIGADERKEMVKRIEDVLIGALALLIFAPLMLVVALLIRLDSPGPIFFRQRRHGFNNEPIYVWKFRSMRAEMTDHTAAQQVTKDDPRVTRLGRFIRKTSIDELPQLFNVLAGEMSLVGPRPHAIGMKTGPDESARLVAEYAWRHRMKPGMTGWAQIKGSRGAMHAAEDVRRRIALDIDYIERHSLWLDLYIMLMTIPCLLGDVKTVR